MDSATKSKIVRLKKQILKLRMEVDDISNKLEDLDEVIDDKIHKHFDKKLKRFIKKEMEDAVEKITKTVEAKLFNHYFDFVKTVTAAEVENFLEKKIAKKYKVFKVNNIKKKSVLNFLKEGWSISYFGVLKDYSEPIIILEKATGIRHEPKINLTKKVLKPTKKPLKAKNPIKRLPAK